MYILRKQWKRDKAAMKRELITKDEDRPVYSATDARRDFAVLLDEAVHTGPVFVTRRKQEAVLISRELYDRLVSLEAQRDAEAAETALNDYHEKGGVCMNELIEELGLD